ncbi:hypothetical protein HNW77_00035 [Komagataeibacter sp. AV436]|uniref:Uncharacterized protein n=1 Tax=Komagataeibacter melomenusus TaxID=2766578 RepID=A0ABX2A8V7_9PROT|nr:hypothetical protein [Komagataeibacter melomenusus]MBV1829248.1 hypothetical protein [Komagataeibacter melomenusus]NPC64819.1 hypothetical protein [Komagataeibacter melomenusus]
MAAKEKPALTIPKKQDIKAYPEPSWVYEFSSDFKPGEAPLQIGAFTAEAGNPRAQEVADHLPKALYEKINSKHGVFPSVSLTPVPDAYVLTGCVTRVQKGDAVGYQIWNKSPATQVEAVITRNNVILGSIQINAVQANPSMHGIGGLIATAIASGVQGTRSQFVAQSMSGVFRRVAKGHLTGFETEQGDGTRGRSLGLEPDARFLFAKPDDIVQLNDAAASSVGGATGINAAPPVTVVPASAPLAPPAVTPAAGTPVVANTTSVVARH